MISERLTAAPHMPRCPRAKAHSVHHQPVLQVTPGQRGCLLALSPCVDPRMAPVDPTGPSISFPLVFSLLLPVSELDKLKKLSHEIRNPGKQFKPPILRSPHWGPLRPTGAHWGVQSGGVSETPKLARMGVGRCHGWRARGPGVQHSCERGKGSPQGAKRVPGRAG